MVDIDRTGKGKIDVELGQISKDRREILRSIHEAVFDRSMSEAGRITTIMARSSTLLVSLSEQADSIQKKMVSLTWAIVFLTAVMVILALVMILK